MYTMNSKKRTQVNKKRESVENKKPLELERWTIDVLRGYYNNAGTVSRSTTDTNIANLGKDLSEELDRRFIEGEITANTYSSYVGRIRKAIKAEFAEVGSEGKYSRWLATKKVQNSYFIELLKAAPINTSTAHDNWHYEVKKQIKEVATNKPELKKDSENILKLGGELDKLRKMIEPSIVRKLTQLEGAKDARANQYKTRKNAREAGEIGFNYDSAQFITRAIKYLNTKSNETAFIPLEVAADGSESLKDESYNYQNGWMAVALAIMLATGRRTYEVLYLSKFQAVSKNKLRITNLAKKKGAAAEESYDIKPLFNAYEVAKAWKYLRESARVRKLTEELDALPEYRRARVFNSRFARLGLSAARSLFTEGLSDLDDKKVHVKPKDLRDIYVMISYELAKRDNDKLRLSAFISNNLHHDQSITAMEYEKFYEVEPITDATVNAINEFNWVEKKQRRTSRTKDIATMLEIKAISKSKKLTFITEEIIKRIRTEPDFKVNSYSLRNFNGKYGENKKAYIAHPKTIARWLEIAEQMNIKL